MGCVSTAAHIEGNQVLGIIPIALTERNFAGKSVGEEFQVPTMQDRIWKMLDNSDAFIALPGGIGTLEEIFQIASWAQLNIHHKPIAGHILISASTAEEVINKLKDFVYKPDLVAA
ncbi:hypothetical protein DITRI_Ditri16bG0075100 [Diplodiscus trichospermus]